VSVVAAGNGGFLPTRTVANAISLVICAVWSISYLADILLKSYEPDPKVHLALMIVIGGPQALNLIRGGGA
jgi:hypothetical protein